MGNIYFEVVLAVCTKCGETFLGVHSDIDTAKGIATLSVRRHIDKEHKFDSRSKRVSHLVEQGNSISVN
jgi:hypothetical protein